MSNIYTKSGDKGQTSLFGGSRVNKNDLRVDCYGTIDEANSMLGMAFALTKNEEVKNIISTIQKKLFLVAAELASDEKGIEMLSNKVSDSDIEFLEKTIDKCFEITGPQTSFVIPGANEVSSALHVSRTIVRRAERSIITLKCLENIRPELQRYVNRLSDAVYALARLEETHAEIEKTKEKALKLILDKLKSNGDNEIETEFNLKNIKIMADIAEEKAKEINVPIVFSAVDSGGNLILLHRMEDSLLGSVDISINKAYTSNALKMPTHQLSDLSVPDKSLYGIQNTNNGRIVVFGGGFPYMFKDKVVGAIGISGGSVEEDMQIGRYVLEKIKKGCI